MQQVTAVAINRERDDRIRETMPIPVEIEKSVGKGMRERMMQWFIGVRHVDAALNEPGSEVFGRLAVPVQFESPIGRLTPTVRLAAIAVLPWFDGKIVVEAQHAKGGNDIFVEILVLVVAPDEYEVRVERIQSSTDRAEVVGHSHAVALCCRVALVVPELGDELGRPIRRVFVIVRHARCRQQAMEARRQTLVGYRQAGVMRAAETENRTHFAAPVVTLSTPTSRCTIPHLDDGCLSGCDWRCSCCFLQEIISVR